MRIDLLQPLPKNVVKRRASSMRKELRGMRLDFGAAVPAEILKVNGWVVNNTSLAGILKGINR